MTPEQIYDATERIAEGFRDMERREPIAYTSAEHRDAEIVRYVVRCLVNPISPHGELLDTIWERRNRVGVTT